MSTIELIGTPVTLWCIASGGTTAFKVTAGTDNDLSDLRELIRNKKPNDFANVDPDNLILWSVNVGQNVIDNINDMLNEDNKLLISGNTVGVTFHDLGGTNIRVVVGVPIIEQPVDAGTKSLDRVYIFVDNSNFLIQGEYYICRKKPLDYLLNNNQIVFDYGLLFKRIKGNRELGNIPVIVGSEISPDDSIYKEGYDIKVFERNCIGKEKGVDNFITLKMAKAFYRESPGTLVLIAGDGDYFETLLEAVNFKWEVEVWFWKGASGYIKGEAKIHYTQLETCYKFFVYATGDNRYNMETLEFTSDTVIEDKEIVEWLANLNLFCWINRKSGTTYLYFNDARELNIAKGWIMREHKEITIWEKKVQRRKQTQTKLTGGINESERNGVGSMDKSHIEALAINIVSKANRSSENINIPKVDPCPICGEDIYTLEGGIIKEFTLASCGDIFHQKCLEEYLVDDGPHGH
ncbi:NYN domain-containing protein [Rhizophagus clarus]|uniref:NYN domain-containing protein n=1 Tax=Rhizophagus clarus TaxID=94130 RepID=A0A8H3LL14_9GLOM|nr:NYN domain-containing protein [Rhizophagus clarus]